MSSSKKENTYFHCGNLVSHGEVEDGKMDVVRLNTALHELGMLSAITESRKQYLQEKATAAKKLAAGRLKETNPVCLKKGFCVLHMNSNYVTDFSGTWKCGSWTNSTRATRLPGDFQSGSRDSGRPDATFKRKDDECCHERSRSRSGRYRLHFQKPYEVPLMNRPERCDWPSRPDPQSELPAKDAGVLGNRSNPGSPEKGSGDSNGLVRSRSLDDIEAINLPLPSLNCQKSEIETVSQRMEGLHVN